MKTLDEVIKAWEICHSDIGDCDECPYHDNCEREIDDDALHYLKEYREMKEHLACLDAATLHGDDTQRVNNPALTWDELKQMIGKPVWLETKSSKRWGLVNKVWYTDFNDGKINIEAKGSSFTTVARSTMGKTWNAYRKERTE